VLHEELGRAPEGRDQSMEWIIVKLHTKLKNLEGKYSDFVNYCADLFAENKRILEEGILSYETLEGSKQMQDLKFEREKVQKGLEYILTVQEDLAKGNLETSDSKSSQDTFQLLSEKIIEAQNQVLGLCIRDGYSASETDIRNKVCDIFKLLNEGVWNLIFRYKVKGDGRVQIRDWIRKIMQLEEDKKALLAQQKDYIDRYSSKIKDKQKNYEQEVSRLEAENTALLSTVGDLKEKLNTINQQLLNQTLNRSLSNQTFSNGSTKEVLKSLEKEAESSKVHTKPTLQGKKVPATRYRSTEYQGRETGKQSPIPNPGTRFSTPKLKDYSPMRAAKSNGFTASTGTISPYDRSLSPGMRTNSTRELKQLKDQLTKLKQERDTLRAWKETVQSEPNYPPPMQRTISELEAEKLNLQRRLSLLQNKTKAFVRGVRSYISTSTRCQKALQLKDKESMRLISKCEEEKFKLEMKLKDLSQEGNEVDSLPTEPRPPSPNRRDINLLQKENELLERENQRLEEMLQRERGKPGTFTKSYEFYDFDFITDEKTDVDRLRRENEQLERENRSLESIIKKERERLDAMKKAFDILEDDYNAMSDAKGKLLGLQQDLDHVKKEKECIEDLLKIERERIITVNKALEAKDKDLQGLNELRATVKSLSMEKEHLNSLLKGLEEVIKKEKESYVTLAKTLEEREKDLAEMSDALADANTLIQENEHLEIENARLEEAIRKEQEKFEILERSFEIHTTTKRDDIQEVDNLNEEVQRLQKENTMLTELAKKEREISENIEKAYADCREEVKELHSFRVKINSLTLENSNLHNSISSLEKLLNNEKSRNETLSCALKSTEKEYSELKADLEQFNNLAIENSSYKQKISSLNETICDLQDNINSLANSDSEKAKQIQELLNYEQKCSELSKVLSSKQDQIHKLSEFKENSNSIILQKDDEIERLHDSLDDAEVKINELYEAYRILEKTNKEVSKHRDELEEANKLLEKNYKDLMKNRDSIEEEKKLLENEIMNIQRFIKEERDQRDTLRRSFESNKIQSLGNGELTEKVNNYTIEKENLEKEIEILRLKCEEESNFKINLEEDIEVISLKYEEECRIKVQLQEEIEGIKLKWDEEMEIVRVKYEEELERLRLSNEEEMKRIQRKEEERKIIKGKYEEECRLRKILESKFEEGKKERERIEEELKKVRLEFCENERAKTEELVTEIEKLRSSYNQEKSMREKAELANYTNEHSLKSVSDESRKLKVILQNTEKRVQELEQEIDMLNDSLRSFGDKDETVRKLAEDLRIQEEKTRSLLSDIETLEVKIIEENNRTSDLEKKLTSLKQDLYTSESEAGKLKQKLSESEAEARHLHNQLKDVQDSLIISQNEREAERLKLINLLSKSEKSFKDLETASNEEKQRLESLLNQCNTKQAEISYIKSWAASEIEKVTLSLSSRFEDIDADLNRKEESLRSIKKKAKEGLEATLKNLVEYNQVITEQVKERENLLFTISDYENTIKSQEELINNLKNKFIGDQFSTQTPSIRHVFETSCEKHKSIISDLTHTVTLKEKQIEELNNRYYELNRENEELAKNKDELEEYYAMFPEKQARLKDTEEKLEHEIKVLEHALEMKSEEMNNLQVNNEHLNRCVNTMNQTIKDLSARITKIQEESEHTIYEKTTQILKLQEEFQHATNKLNEMAECYENSNKQTDEKGTGTEDGEYFMRFEELKRNLEEMGRDNEVIRQDRENENLEMKEKLNEMKKELENVKNAKENEVEECMRIMHTQKVKINELQSEITNKTEAPIKEIKEKLSEKDREILTLQEEKGNLLSTLQSLRQTTSDQLNHYEAIANKHISEVTHLKSELKNLEECLGPHFRNDLYASVSNLVKRVLEPAAASLPPIYPRSKPHENDMTEIDIQLIRASGAYSEDEARSEASSSFIAPNLPTEVQALQDELIEQMKIVRHHERQIKVYKQEIENIKRRNRRQDMLERSSEESSVEGDHMKDIVMKLAKSLPMQ
jgi:chromosome segregation ATPase